jgi:hypothetical protein
VQLVKFRVKGSSILEVVVGIFIISLSLALTGSLFAQVFASSDRMLKQKAWFAENKIGNEVVLSENTETETIEYPSFTIIKTGEPVDQKKELWMIKIEAFDSNKKMIISRRFLLKKETTDQE